MRRRQAFEQMHRSESFALEGKPKNIPLRVEQKDVVLEKSIDSLKYDRPIPVIGLLANKLNFNSVDDDLVQCGRCGKYFKQKGFGPHRRYCK